MMKRQLSKEEVKKIKKALAHALSAGEILQKSVDFNVVAKEELDDVFADLQDALSLVDEIYEFKEH